MENEVNMAALFTTSNGYMGIRGSFEEYGCLRIQGCYIRGLLDEVYEPVQPFPDNLYIKNTTSMKISLKALRNRNVSSILQIFSWLA